MKKITIEPKVRFSASFRYILDVIVSQKNLISDDEIEEITKQLFSQFEDVDVCVVVLRETNNHAKIKLDVRYFQENDYLFGCLDVFLYYLGNIRIFQKKIEYVNGK